MTSIRKTAVTVTLGAAAAFLVAGPYMAYRGADARTMVRDELRSEHIVTPDDASRPGIRVQDGPSAVVQADIIKHHALEATGGKTFSQMERTDPARATAFQASALRTSLLASALAWNVANLVIGLGALVFVLGLVLLAVGLTLRKPEQVVLTATQERSFETAGV